MQIHEDLFGDMLATQCMTPYLNYSTDCTITAQQTITEGTTFFSKLHECSSNNLSKQVGSPTCTQADYFSVANRNLQCLQYKALPCLE